MFHLIFVWYKSAEMTYQNVLDLHYTVHENLRKHGCDPVKKEGQHVSGTHSSHKVAQGGDYDQTLLVPCFTTLERHKQNRSTTVVIIHVWSW